MVLRAAQALAWRLRRLALEPAAGTGVFDVVRRVVALRGWPLDLADLAITVRQAQPNPGGLESALDSKEVIRSYAFRGGSYVFTADIAAVLLSVRTLTRVWETSRWQRQGGFALEDWEPLRDAVREGLGEGPMTREEIAIHLGRIPGLRHLCPAAAGAGADSLYKPLHWWGDICFGPVREGRTTFRLLGADVNSSRPRREDVDDAGRRAVLFYLGSYGAATKDNLLYWLTEGLGAPRRRLLGWVADLADEVSEVTVDGASAYVLTTDLEELSASEPTDVVRLLPGFDPWVMGPGTADARIITPARRSLASRGANLVIRGGVVTGTWRVKGHEVTVSWFDEAGPASAVALQSEVRRLAAVRGQELTLTLMTA